MNREDIIRMARRYGYVIAEDGPDSQCEVSFSADQLLALLQFAVAAEREACAKACDRMVMYGPVAEVQQRYNKAYADCRDAIRARGEHETRH